MIEELVVLVIIVAHIPVAVNSPLPPDTRHINYLGWSLLLKMKSAYIYVG